MPNPGSTQDQRLALPHIIIGWATIVGAVLRMGMSFVPWRDEDAVLEILAFYIDVSILLGLATFYFAHSSRLGIVGVIGFVIAAAGLALITGPDSIAFGRDSYQSGIAVIAIGLLTLSLVMLKRKIAPIAAGCWLTSLIANILGGLLAQAEIGFAIAGVLYSAGFALIGRTLLLGQNRALQPER